jgi:hypothetical protein
MIRRLLPLLLQIIQVVSKPTSHPTFPQLKPYFEDAHGQNKHKNQNTVAPTLAPTPATLKSGVFAPSKVLAIHADVIRSNFVTVSWLPPKTVDNGRIKVSNSLSKRFEYQLQWCEQRRIQAGPGAWRSVCQWQSFSGLGPGKHSSMTVGDLKPGKHYNFRVRAAEPVTQADSSHGYMEIKHKWGAWGEGAAVTRPRSASLPHVNQLNVGVVDKLVTPLSLTLEMLVPCHTGAAAASFRNQQVRRVQARHRLHVVPATAEAMSTGSVHKEGAGMHGNIGTHDEPSIGRWVLQRSHDIDVTANAKTAARDGSKEAARVLYKVTGLLPRSTYELQVK